MEHCAMAMPLNIVNIAMKKMRLNIPAKFQHSAGIAK